MITEEQTEVAAREFYWRTTGDVFAENSRPDMVIGFYGGAKWALEQIKWISVKDGLPEDLQRVMFVVDSPGSYYHGKVYGGSYTGGIDPQNPINEFSTPGWGCRASHWMPSPEPPKTEQK